MAEKRTIDEIAKQQEIGEFMTTWDDFPRPGLTAWADRRKAGLMGNAKSSRYTPKFRPFDMLAEPNQSLVFLANANHRIGVESVFGVQDAFHRYVDADMIYFQYCGHTTLETEFGIHEMAPGDVLLVPGGIAHRSIGTADSLRYCCLTHEPVHYVMNEDQYTSETTYQMKRIGGPSWQLPPGADQPSTGRVVERMHCWDDRPDDYTILERDYEDLVGVASLRGPAVEKGGIRKVRAFDHFTAIVGKGGADAGTQPLMLAEHLRIRTYNMLGEQFAFHRALRSEEVRIQFRGDAVDMSEFENVDVRPGDVTIIPLGIAHSVITDPPDDPSFLRLNFYSTLPWKVVADPTKHAYESHFECKTTVRKEAEWREALMVGR
jgi:quercetin dioxygenase-like cupin family protein